MNPEVFLYNTALSVQLPWIAGLSLQVYFYYSLFSALFHPRTMISIYLGSQGVNQENHAIQKYQNQNQK